MLSHQNDHACNHLVQPEERRDMVEKATYQGNCHCAKFRFEVQLPDITSAITCNCTACFKTGFLWAFPADGDYRVIRDDGLLIGTQHGKTLDRKVLLPDS